MTRIETRGQRSTIALASPQSVAAALPHLLGFHPEESLICLWLRGGELLVVQRADLTETGSDRVYVQAYLDAASNIHADEVVTVCVTRHKERGRSLLRTMTKHIESELDDVRVRGTMIISGGQVRAAGPGESWHWISSHDRQRAGEVFASHTDGPRVRRNRREVVSEVEYDESAGGVIQGATTSNAEVLCALLASGDVTGLKARAILRDSATGVRGRDLIMWWCARVAMGKRRELLETLLGALRATPPSLGGHLACVTAATAWLCGDGVRANAAVDRCLDEDPANAMGLMIEAAMAAALPPSAFARMLAEVDPEEVGANQSVVDSLKGCGYSPR